MIYFSDFFGIDERLIEDYGAFNISLINDLPLFIDPFLLFGSTKSEYQVLHNEILEYLKFLKVKSEEGISDKAQIIAWYKFSEVKQNWLGYSLKGNSGSGLGFKFGESFSSNLSRVFHDLGNETVTLSSHIEKAALFEMGVGKDNISDFTCNLIKRFLLEYTEQFALKYLDDAQTRIFNVSKVYFDYNLERWMPKEYKLPFFENDYVLLTPKDILTKDDNWINSHDLKVDFERICNSIPNDQLRAEIFNYFRKKLSPPIPNKKIPQKEITQAVKQTVQEYPEILDYFIKSKEENKQGAKSYSELKVKEVERIFIKQVKELVRLLSDETNFYKIDHFGSFEEAYRRVSYLKSVIEDKDGYRIFYHDGKPIKRENDLQIMFRLVCNGSDYDIIPEANAGRGPVDYVVTKGTKDKTLVEFKLASNKKLKQNLANQVEVYQKAHDTNSSIKVILYFENHEFNTVQKILKELGIEDSRNIILIDAGKKESASMVKLI